MESPPAPEEIWKTYPPSAEAYDHIHAAGFVAWHWFSYHSTTTPMGRSSTTYFHLFIPYWMVFIPLLLAACSLYPRGAKSGPE